MHKFLQEAKVGLELTFHSDDSRAYVTNNGFPQAEAARARAWWKQVKVDWAKSVTYTDLGMEDFDDMETFKIEPAGRGDAQKDLGGGIGAETTQVFRYSREGEPYFWFDLSMDPGVVEIRTMPIPAKQFMDAETGITRILKRHVFEAAVKNFFDVGGGGDGGGHLNIDFGTGFSSNYKLVVKVLAEAEEVVWRLPDKPDHLQLTNEDVKDLYDPVPVEAARAQIPKTFAVLIDTLHGSADPFLSYDRVSPKRMKSVWEQVLTHNVASLKYDRNATYLKDALGSKGMASDGWKRFIQDHADWLHANPTLYQYGQATKVDKNDCLPTELKPGASDVELKKVLHYQAINIGHVRNDEPEKSRVEFRFFKGQRNIDDIRNGLRLIALLVRRAENR